MQHFGNSKTQQRKELRALEILHLTSHLSICWSLGRKFTGPETEPFGSHGMMMKDCVLVRRGSLPVGLNSSDQYSSTIKPTNLPDASVSNAICGSSPVHYASYHPLWTRRHIYLRAQFYVACVFLSDVPSQALVVSVKPSQMPSTGTNTMSKASFTESSILYPHLQGAGHASVHTEPVFGRCYRCLLSASPNCDYDCIIMNHHHRSR